MSTSTGEQRVETSTIPVSGMTCDACERRVGRALGRLPGVTSVEVSARRGTATLSGPALPSRDQVSGALRAAGYDLGSPRWLSADRSTWTTVGVAALALLALATVLGTAGLGDAIGRLASPTGGGLLLVLTLGLAAGFSTCMAMVGGLVLAFSATHAAARAAAGLPPASLASRMRPHVAFNVGRILGFGVLGAGLGALGAAVGMPTRLIGALALAVAAVMLLLGIRLTGVSPRMAAWSPRLPAGLAGRLGIEAGAGRPYSDTRTALIGAATFLLPCGFTQAVQVFALATGSPLEAGLVMATFAVGTTPGLLAIASVPEVAKGRARDTVLQVVGVVVLAFAVVNASSGMNLLGFARSAPAAAVAQEVSGNVTVADGVQTVRMAQARDGYTPADTVVYAGMPISWEIDAASKWECSAFLRVPELDVSVNLQDGRNVVDLPALSPGIVPFNCVMGMYTGNLIAIEPPAS